MVCEGYRLEASGDFSREVDDVEVQRNMWQDYKLEHIDDESDYYRKYFVNNGKYEEEKWWWAMKIMY